MRGEHSRVDICFGMERGSSPHARGAPQRAICRTWSRGIIPACAGSTFKEFCRINHVRDHPRMRGEHYGELLRPYSNRGSSPHARGALNGRRTRPNQAGIIPACAGSTVSPKVGHDAEGGSSPHARGAPHDRISEPVVGGIIPACAGSTPTRWISRSWRWDHPRMRGEHYSQHSRAMASLGSSPHARGALPGHRRVLRRPGIIPACAGSTRCSPSCPRRSRDHPRMRGEHDGGQIGGSNPWGSSPHARGAHFTTSASGRHSRLIHSLFASSSHPSGLSSDYIFARRDTCWHCSNPWRAHRQASRHQYHSVGG